MINAKGCNNGFTPSKAKVRPGGGNPSPVKGKTNLNAVKSVKTKTYRKQGR